MPLETGNFPPPASHVTFAEIFNHFLSLSSFFFSVLSSRFFFSLAQVSHFRKVAEKVPMGEVENIFLARIGR